MALLPLTSGGRHNFIFLPNTHTCYKLLQHFGCLPDTLWWLTVVPYQVTLMPPVKQWVVKLQLRANNETMQFTCSSQRLRQSNLESPDECVGKKVT